MRPGLLSVVTSTCGSKRRKEGKGLSLAPSEQLERSEGSDAEKQADKTTRDNIWTLYVI